MQSKFTGAEKSFKGDPALPPFPHCFLAHCTAYVPFLAEKCIFEIHSSVRESEATDVTAFEAGKQLKLMWQAVHFIFVHSAFHIAMTSSTRPI